MAPSSLLMELSIEQPLRFENETCVSIFGNQFATKLSYRCASAPSAHGVSAGVKTLHLWLYYGVVNLDGLTDKVIFQTRSGLGEDKG
jgi:hypothetical protein